MPRILIVEDEAIVAMELQERIGSLGYTPTVVATGEDAVVSAERSTPDLVLMDIRLGGRMDGIDAARRIRQSLDVPIVYLTAHTDDSTLERAKQTEPVGYLPKPFDESSLRLTLELALYRHAAERQRREAETARRRAEARYAAVLESSSDAILGLDKEGRIVLANPATRGVFGADAGAVLGMSIDALLPGCREVSDGRVSLQGRRVDGEPFQAELTIWPVNDEDLLYTVVVRDVTEQRQLEEQLMQARRMEAVGRLATGAAHDFNNVLSVVLGYAQMIERAIAKQTVPALDDARQIVDACQRAATLTRQLLIFGRPKKSTTQVVDASQIVSALGPMLKRLIGEHIHLDIQSDPDLYTSIDPGNLEQIVMNLAVNARDAMIHGGALLIAVRADAGDVLVEATDTGEGMSAEVRERIFEPFFTTKEAGRGTGLGLSNVARIVEAARGSIEVQSELGQGTTVCVRLPRSVLGPVEGSKATHPWQPGSATVLLVEDDDQLRAVTQRVLVEGGHTTLVARDAVEATRLLESYPKRVELLLADVVLPGVGGPELAEDIHRRHPDMRVLLMSGHQPGFISQWGAGSQPALLVKPFSPVELLDAVATALGDAPPG